MVGGGNLERFRLRGFWYKKHAKKLIKGELEINIGVLTTLDGIT